MRSPREHWTCTRTVFHEMQSLRDGFFQEGEGEGESRILGLVMNLYPGPSLVHRGYYISKKFVKTSTKYLKATSWPSSISRHGDDCSMSDRKTVPGRSRRFKSMEVPRCFVSTGLSTTPATASSPLCTYSSLAVFSLSYHDKQPIHAIPTPSVYCHSIFPLSYSRGQLLSQ